ncbi:MAG: N-acetylmuramoyl-L-alanine amidase [Polaribacter sp.]
MRDISQIVVHCAATPEGQYFDANDIRRWHVQERGWSDIGYHYIILLDGTIQFGRPLEQIGAHVAGRNSRSVGICYIGGADGIDTRTEAQKESLLILLKYLKLVFKDAEILGHRDFEGVYKDCPSFDAKNEYKDL